MGRGENRKGKRGGERRVGGKETWDGYRRGKGAKRKRTGREGEVTGVVPASGLRSASIQRRTYLLYAQATAVRVIRKTNTKTATGTLSDRQECHCVKHVKDKHA